MTELVVIGAGGFGREALSVALAAQKAGTLPFDSLTAVDDNPTPENLERLSTMGIGFLGPTDGLLAKRGRYFVVAVGSPSTRARIAANLEARGLEAAIVVHPTAVVDATSVIGPGTVICAGVQVSVNVRLGRHTHLNPASVVGHDSTLGDCVSVNPNATISGDVIVGPRVLVGAAAVVLQGLTVGADAIIGAAACVVRSVSDGMTVKGVPAR